MVLGLPSSDILRLGRVAQLCTHWALHKKTADARLERSWNWRALIWETGVRVYAHNVSGFFIWLDFLTLWPIIRHHISTFFFLFFLFGTGSPKIETLKRRGNTVKEFSVLREFEFFIHCCCFFEDLASSILRTWGREAPLGGASVKIKFWMCQTLR